MLEKHFILCNPKSKWFTIDWWIEYRNDGIMNIGLYKQQRFSLRKLNTGLASVAFFSITKVVQVSTDETCTPVSSESTKVTETPKVT